MGCHVGEQVIARRDDTPNMKELKEIVQHVKPSVLIGLAGAGPAFEQVRVPACRYLYGECRDSVIMHA